MAEVEAYSSRHHRPRQAEQTNREMRAKRSGRTIEEQRKVDRAMEVVTAIFTVVMVVVISAAVHRH